MLQTFAIDYDFLQIEKENTTNLSKELNQELDFRYEHFLKHSNEYKDWDEIKHKYLKNEN